VKRDKTTDARAIAHHYDVSNEFYALFLDPLMVYTCAYYRDPDGKLEQAQQDKLDHVCRKLDLRPGETLLDIGCGWGGLSMWAARHYGVRAQGVTLSRAQADYAAERIRREGLEGRCRVDYMDYRDLPPEVVYDKIAAVGVIEHVGIPNYPAFFGGVRSRLKDGGLYLNHGIVHEFGWKHSSQFEFLLRHVFPNGELASISQTLTEQERGLGDHGRRGATPALRPDVPALGRAALRARRRGAGPGRRAHVSHLAPVSHLLGGRVRVELARPLSGRHAQAPRPEDRPRAAHARATLRSRTGLSAGFELTKERTWVVRS
jgi:cyclopropane fatty-acyl-phospholipid synthase-like methyltransferase